jgi:GDP-L-fucose synthase
MAIDLASERILVTGAHGFLGRHVVEALKFAGVGAPNAKGELLTPTREELDLCDEDQVDDWFDQVKPSVVVHLAAVCGGIGANMAEPGRFFYDNMQMGLNVIHYAMLAHAKKVLVVGTVCSYPRDCPTPFREEDFWNGYPEATNAPYGIAKKALLVMLQAYREQYGLNGIYLIPANLYGPGDNFDPKTSHVIPALIRKFAEAKASGAKSVELWGTGNATREFLYAEDCARGIVYALQRYDSGEPVNMSSERVISIRDLAGMIQKLVGFNGEIVWDASKPDGQANRSVSSFNAWALFDWVHCTPTLDGLRKTIEWYQNEISLGQSKQA